MSQPLQTYPPHNPFNERIHVATTFDGVASIQAVWDSMRLGGAGILRLILRTPSDELHTAICPAHGALRDQSSRYLKRVADAINSVSLDDD